MAPSPLAPLFSGRHDLLMGARRGSSLAVGYGDGDDVHRYRCAGAGALHQTVSYLEDEDWVVVTQDGAKVYQGDQK